MEPSLAELRQVLPEDLTAVNAVIERAVMTWDLAPRVKRLSLPLYRYDRQDLDTFDALLARSPDERVLAVAAWGPADPGDVPEGRIGIQIHGLYVEPGHHGGGLGTRLLRSVEGSAAEQGADGLLVKAQRGAEGFFLSRGFGPVAVRNPARQYPYCLWKEILC